MPAASASAARGLQPGSRASVTGACGKLLSVRRGGLTAQVRAHQDGRSIGQRSIGQAGGIDSALRPYHESRMSLDCCSRSGSLFPALSVFALLCLAAAGCTPQTFVSTSVPAASAPARGLTVAGVGKASGAPNVARSTIGVEARASSADSAIAEVNSGIAKVIAAVTAAGVAQKDIRTSNLSLNFERSYEPPRPLEVEPAATGKPPPSQPQTAPVPKLPQGFYTASNSVEVTIRELDRAGQVLSAATSAGANQLYGLRFELEEPAALLAEARSKAMADAQSRASQLAKLAGMKLGQVLSVTELDGGAGSGPMPAFAMMKQEAAASVEGGELTVTSAVQVVYALPE